ncbi:MAG: tetratricopeptide repeat protein [bacterium]|nr:tetratricopeptide repeat protein [bacterium]
MKRCPQCRRDYHDETLLYCLDDGNPLLDGPASGSEPPASAGGQFDDGPKTAILSEPYQVSAGFRDAEPKTALYQNVSDDSIVKSIAVLPFVNMSADPENEYFCDGIAEELLNALAKIDGLRVAARTSSFSFKSKNAAVGEIGKALNVRSILEGSVRKSGNRVRITVQLINAADGYHLWSEVYDRELRDVFAIQDEITAATIKNLKLKLLEFPVGNIGRPENFEAHNECLRGRHYLNKRTADDILKGVQYFEKALLIDKDYAPALSGLADSYNLLGAGDYAVMSPDDAFPKAKEAALRALEIDPASADAHTALGWSAMVYDWDYVKSETHYLKAIEIKPGYATAHHWYGMLLAERGDFDEAVSEMKHACSLDPLSPIVNADLAWVLYNARRYDEAIAQCRATLEIEPNFSVAYWNLGQSLRENGSLPEAIAAFETADRLSGGNQVFRAALAHALALNGERDRATEILEEFSRKLATAYVAPHAMVMIYIGLGEHDNAFEWLERSFQERSDFIVEAKINPAIDPLRDDSRFDGLLRRANLSDRIL